MKNSEEFRRTVFEKAKQYEAKRKARNRKIIELTSLCSLCIVIGISAYFGIMNITNMDADGLTDTNISNKPSPEIEDGIDGTPADVQIPEATTDVTEPIWSTTCAPHSTAAMPMATTTISTTSIYTTSVEAPIASLSMSVQLPTETEETTNEPITEQLALLFINSHTCADATNATGLTIFLDHADFTKALTENHQVCLSENEKSMLQTMIDPDFFSQNVLLALHIPESYIWESQITDGNIVFTAQPKENADDFDNQALALYACPLEEFRAAALHIPE